MADITFTEVTTGTLDGTGVFDQLMRSVKAHVKEEWDEGRIKGSDYSTVYLGSMQTAIAQAIAFVLEKDNKSKQAEMTEAQIALYDRQRQGFDDNKYQKLLETQMNSWALMFSSGLLTEKPSIITSDQVSILYNHLKP